MSEIQFDTIPNSIRKPGVYIEYNTRLAVNTLPGNPQRMLIIGPMINNVAQTGYDYSNTIIPIYSDTDAAKYFGAGSLAANMATAAIRANPYLQLDVIGIDDDSAGVASTGTIGTAGDVATSNGTLTITVSGTPVTVAIEKGDKPADILKAASDAMKNVPELMIKAEVSEQIPAVLNLTALNKGAWGDDIFVETATTATGVIFSTGALSGGEMNPDISAALDIAFSAGHNIIAIPFTTDVALAALSEHLTNTGNAIEQRGAVGCAGWINQLGQAVTYASGVNDGRISVAWYKGSVKVPGVLAAAYGAVIASEEDPARPLNTLPLAGMDVVNPQVYISRTEQENALHNGITPIEVGPGNTVQIVRAVSTYTVNAQGVDDPSLLDITSIRTLDYVRKACRDRISLRFPREKLSTRTPPKVRSELYDVLTKLEDAEIIENVAVNKDKLIVQKSGTDPNRCDAVIPADVVNGLHVFAGRIDMIL